MRDLDQSVQRELQIGLIGPTAGAQAYRRQRALVAEGCDTGDEVLPVLGERLDALFRGARPLVAVAELGNVLEEVVSATRTEPQR